MPWHRVVGVRGIIPERSVGFEVPWFSVDMLLSLTCKHTRCRQCGQSGQSIKSLLRDASSDEVNAGQA